MIEDAQKRYADDITLNGLVKLRVENEKLKDKNKQLTNALAEINKVAVKMLAVDKYENHVGNLLEVIFKHKNIVKVD